MLRNFCRTHRTYCSSGLFALHTLSVHAPGEPENKRNKGLMTISFR